MNLNSLLKLPIILAEERLCKKKRRKLSLIACRERSHWLQVNLQDQA
jgi:hypothetical protein